MIGADKFIHKLIPECQNLHATQRYQRGYSDIDMWNFDGMLSDLIVAGCDWFLSSEKRRTGAPGGMDIEDWYSDLTKIRDGFSRRHVIGSRTPPSDEAWALLKLHFGHLWD